MAERHQVMLPSGGVNMCVLFFPWPGFFPLGFPLARFLMRYAIHLLMASKGECYEILMWMSITPIPSKLQPSTSMV